MLADQGALLAIFLSLLGLLMVLVTDTHHVMLLAIADSYTLFEPGVVPPFGDFADMVSRVVRQLPAGNSDRGAVHRRGGDLLHRARPARADDAAAAGVLCPHWIGRASCRDR